MVCPRTSKLTQRRKDAETQLRRGRPPTFRDQDSLRLRRSSLTNRVHSVVSRHAASGTIAPLKINNLNFAKRTTARPVFSADRCVPAVSILRDDGTKKTPLRPKNDFPRSARGVRQPNVAVNNGMALRLRIAESQMRGLVVSPPLLFGVRGGADE